MTISVTQLIELYPEKELVEWQMRDPKKAKQVSEEALRIGKAVDELVQRQYRQQPIDVPANDPPVIQAWENWQVFLSEYPTFLSYTSGIQEELTFDSYVGHPDFRRKLANQQQRGIDDLKCASQIRPSHFVQLGGYAWLEMAGLGLPMPDWLGIIRLNKDRPGYEYLQLNKPEQIQTAIDAWLHYKSLYELRDTVRGWVRDYREAEALDGV